MVGFVWLEFEYVVLAGLELTATFLPTAPKRWGYSLVSPHPAFFTDLLRRRLLKWHLESPSRELLSPSSPPMLTWNAANTSISTTLKT